MSFLPLTPELPKYKYSTARFLDRTFGVEYLDFEMEQMRSLYNARRQEHDVEVTGFVSWLTPPNFVLLASPTTPNTYILCKTGDFVEYPPQNQYVTVKGKWLYSLKGNSALVEKTLLVEDIIPSRPDYGRLEPEISTDEFRNILFEKWINIEDTTQQLIAQSLVSSPPIYNQRAGGLTLTMANYAKQLPQVHLKNDLRRFLPRDLLSSKSVSFEINELGIKHSLPISGWQNHVEPLNSISKTVDLKLDRSSNDEYGITLLQDNGKPLDFNLRGLIKSDYPIVLEQSIERRGINKDVDPQVYKYLLAVRLSAPIVNKETYDDSLELCRNRLERFSNTNEILKKYSGNNQFYDLGIKGKPLSVHSLSVSVGRALSHNTLEVNDIENTCDTYLENLKYIIDVHEDWFYDQISATSSIRYDERRVYVFFIDRQQATMKECAEHMKMDYQECDKVIQSLLRKGRLYDRGNDRYSPITN